MERFYYWRQRVRIYHDYIIDDFYLASSGIMLSASIRTLPVFVDFITFVFLNAIDTPHNSIERACQIFIFKMTPIANTPLIRIPNVNTSHDTHKSPTTRNYIYQNQIPVLNEAPNWGQCLNNGTTCIVQAYSLCIVYEYNSVTCKHMLAYVVPLRNHSFWIAFNNR